VKVYSYVVLDDMPLRNNICNAVVHGRFVRWNTLTGMDENDVKAALLILEKQLTQKEWDEKVRTVQLAKLANHEDYSCCTGRGK